MLNIHPLDLYKPQTALFMIILIDHLTLFNTYAQKIYKIIIISYKIFIKII